ncbi:hypothetical protein BT69DRAFT_1275878 [Atractiella rhizophila]|nr:hypothetical protein BT69DRAFT_1275878 [Atractiella rhizophila]
MSQPAWIVQELAKLTELDTETVSVQIIPYLQSMKTHAEVSEYLSGLLGVTPSSSAYRQRYLAFRFPHAKPAPQQAAPSGPSKHHPNPQWVKPASSATTPSGSKAGSKTGTPRTQTPVVDERVVQAAFGAGGTVYVKNKDEITFAGTGKGKGKKAAAGSGPPSLASSAQVSKVPTPVATPPPPRSSPITVGETPSTSHHDSSNLRPDDHKKITKPIANNPKYKNFSISALETLSSIEISLRNLSTPPTTKQLLKHRCFCRCKPKYILCPLLSPCVPLAA